MDNKYENNNIRRGAAWRLGEMCLMWGANASSMWGSPSVAWYVDFSIGSAYYSDKYNSSRVRAVIDF